MKEAILYGNDKIVDRVIETERAINIKNKNIEKTIDAICERIQRDVKRTDSLSGEILGLSKAVAELTEARMKM